MNWLPIKKNKNLKNTKQNSVPNRKIFEKLTKPKVLMKKRKGGKWVGGGSTSVYLRLNFPKKFE